jgi:peptidoglycan/LPS O-acetylase OafA/YrhL
VSPNDSMKTEHIDFLDSLRGLAALQVVLSHALAIFPGFYSDKHHGAVNGPVANWLTHSPLHLFWDGNEAVIFFFVLSGFVLALPYVRGRTPAYVSYLIKRVCRIYLPYLVIILLSSGLLLLNLAHHAVEGASSAFQQEWAKPVSGREVMNFFLMRGDFHNVDKAVWSLVIEMKISVIFPVLVWMVMRIGPKFNVGLALLAAVLAAILQDYLNGHAYWSTFDILYYVPFFIFGIVAAKYRQEISRVMAVWPSWQKIFFILGCLFFYNWQWEIWGLPFFKGKDEWVAFFAVGIGSTGLIVAALSFERLQKILEHPVLLWIGKRSYSLYLVHVVVLLVAVHYLPEAIPLWNRVVLGGLASIAAAGISYHWLEVPCRTLGYRLEKKL